MSGPSAIIPPGATGPGKVLPPPLVPTNGFTYAAGFWGVCAAPATATVAPGCAARKTAAHSALLPVSDHALTRAFYLLQDFPGEAEVVLEMQTTAGARRLRLGPSYRVTPSPSLRASLDQLLGDAALAA